MKISDSDNLGEHIDDLRLAYSENLLSAEERVKFEEHLQKCQDCAKKMTDLTKWMDTVKSNKHAFCPEEWELFDYARCVGGASGILDSHVDNCPSCRKTVEAFRELAHNEGVPEELWQRMTGIHEQPRTAPLALVRTWFHSLLDQFSDFLRPRFVFAAAVAAAILVAVLIFPTGTSGPVLGLSSVHWGPSHPLNLMGRPERAVPKGAPKKERLAIVLYFNDFKSQPDQERIDSFYKMLDPGRDVRLSYDLVSPSDVKEALESAGSKEGGKNEVLRVVRDKLFVTQMLIMEISEKADRFGIKVELMDAKAGTLIRGRELVDIREADLAEQVEAASESVLTVK